MGFAAKEMPVSAPKNEHKPPKLELIKGGLEEENEKFAKEIAQSTQELNELNAIQLQQRAERVSREDDIKKSEIRRKIELPIPPGLEPETLKVVNQAEEDLRKYKNVPVVSPESLGAEYEPPDDELPTLKTQETVDLEQEALAERYPTIKTDKTMELEASEAETFRRPEANKFKPRDLMKERIPQELTESDIVPEQKIDLPQDLKESGDEEAPTIRRAA